MGFFLEFDAPNNTVRLAFEDTVTESDIGGAAYGALRSFVASRPPCRGIADFSPVTNVDATGELIRHRATLPPAMTGGLPFVLVAPQDHLYGLSRMFSLAADRSRPHLKVVRTMQQAYQMLGITSPHFVRVAD